MRVWDLRSGSAVGTPITGSGKEVFAVATAQLDGRPVIVAGGLDDDIHLWDLATHAAVGAPLATGGRTVFDLVVTQLADRPVVVEGTCRESD